MKKTIFKSFPLVFTSSFDKNGEKKLFLVFLD